MKPKQDQRTLYSISCSCGATTSMDARAFGRPTVCKKCGGSFTVGWGTDPKTRKTAPIAVTLARKRGGPLQVSCSCGYRRSVTAAEAATHNRCPGCGKSMIVEKPPTGKVRDSDRVVKLSSASPSRRTEAPPPRAPAPASVAAPPQLIVIGPETNAFNCPCGERLLVRTHTVGNVTECPSCARKLRVEINRNARKGSSTTLPAVSLPGSQTPTPPPGGKSPTPPPAFTKAELSCECGQSLEIVKAFDAHGTVCPACGRTITMEKIRRPESKHTVIRPRFGPKAGPAPEAPPPPAAPKIPVAPASEPGGMFEMPTAEFVEEDVPAAGSPTDSYQEVFCPCGEALTVGTEDVGKNMQCPTCLTLMAVDQLRDPKTGSGVLRVRAIGKMDQDTWSLSDFS